MYHHRFTNTREHLARLRPQSGGRVPQIPGARRLEIITCAATHALLPLLAEHPQSIRAQILVARDHYRECFGCDPRGIWLPECAYVDGVENFLQEANIRWFIMDTHGLLHARPRPRYGVFAPVFTPNCIAAFGRDLDSARQVWSKHEGYPGDVNYRDFYRDIGFDLDFDYVKPHLPDVSQRGFTGIKYHRITGDAPEKRILPARAALRMAAEHAGHFLNARMGQIQHLASIMDRPPMLVSPYDAELFGHWWYEGPEFLDYFVRKANYDQQVFRLITPHEYLGTASDAADRAAERVKLGLGRLLERVAQRDERMDPAASAHRAGAHDGAGAEIPDGDGVKLRAFKQAGRELLLAQASDWPFILRTGTSPDYARKRVKDHLLRFIALHEQLTMTHVDEAWLAQDRVHGQHFPGHRLPLLGVNRGTRRGGAIGSSSGRPEARHYRRRLPNSLKLTVGRRGVACKKVVCFRAKAGRSTLGF